MSVAWISRPIELTLFSHFGVTIPKELMRARINRVYRTDHKITIGETDYFATFKARKAPSPIPSEFKRSQDSGDCTGKIKDRMVAGLNNLKVPAEFQPDFSEGKEYYWAVVPKDSGGELFLLYQPHSLRFFMYAKFV